MNRRQREALEAAQTAAYAAYAELAQAKAVVAQRETEYGEAVSRLNRAIHAVLYPEPTS